MAIEVRDLSLSIGKSLLLDSISFHVGHGEQIALVGANGAGKTTLLRCLLGLLPHGVGGITLNGTPLKDLSHRERARNIAYVPQQLPSDIDYTALEFITMSRYAHGDGLRPRDAKSLQAARTAMDQTGIGHLAHRALGTLSGGERQRVSIAAALAQQSPVLLLDEPSAHLDPKQREDVQSLLCDIGRDHKTTILIATHDLNWAAMHFDRMVGMSCGRILSDAPPDEFMTRASLRDLFGAEWTIQPHPQTGSPMIIPSHRIR